MNYIVKEERNMQEKRQGKLPVKNYVGYAMGDMAGVITFVSHSAASRS